MLGPSAMGALVRALDWATTPLGPLASWPASMAQAMSMVLYSRFPFALLLGPDFVCLYNDAYIPILGERHPAALGTPMRLLWPEIWHLIGPMMMRAVETGVATWSDDQPVIVQRHGYREESFFTWSFSPVRGEGGKVVGLLGPVIMNCNSFFFFLMCMLSSLQSYETTKRVLSDRRMHALHELGQHMAGACTTGDVYSTVSIFLERNRADISFALMYSAAQNKSEFALESVAGVSRDHAAAAAGADWPLAQALHERRSVVVDQLETRIGQSLPGGVWPEPTSVAVVCPLAADDKPLGAVVLGVSPRCALDDDYRVFLELFARQLGNALVEARAHEAERQRSEALHQLDIAKSNFFANVSHEFRTPLHLMLGPLEQLVDRSSNHDDRDCLLMVQRNAQRLQRLVNSLLDFSRIEAGRMGVQLVATDLSSTTQDLASVFRAAIEVAGLVYDVQTPPLPWIVNVDRDMWEKIVFNLLSNALKYTLQGSISLRLAPVSDDRSVRLTVTDTGCGIPADELPKLFQRFHRVASARGRSHEGAGIGLALTAELVNLHGGSITVDSVLGSGTTFTVTLPVGVAQSEPVRLCVSELTASDRASIDSNIAAVHNVHGDSLIDSITSTSSSISTRTTSNSADSVEPQRRPIVLLVDDNADMRSYLTKLLQTTYDVRCARDGQHALDLVAQHGLPDIVLTDWMMPIADGGTLVRAMRAGAGTKHVPIIVLSARSGDDSRVQGIEAGADDYLAKPFSAKELLARMQAQLRRGQNSQSDGAITASDLRFGKILGEGTFGVVYEGVYRGQRLAIKKFMSATSGREIELLSSVRHRHIVQCVGAYSVAPDTFLIMELAECSLQQAIQTRNISYDLAIDWARQIAVAMDYLHTGAPQSIIHRDLKPANVLVFADGTLKLSDFGLARRLDGRAEAMSSVGTFEYMAPEVIRAEPYTDKADVYSYGVVLWKIKTRRQPYEGLPALAIAFGVGSGNLSLAIDETDSDWPSSYADLTRRCMSTSAQRRPSFRDVLAAIEQ